ncbi:MAG TPA: hypothetical protein VG753_01165 [Candidatus Paceibacterota bacterium]|nr:hypothetical protein [Candidatus Paceibacterota bacterium]
MNTPLTYVVFGATGDLAQRKIMPALCALSATHDLTVIAFSRRPWSDEEYRAFIAPSLKRFDAAAREKFVEQVRYAQGTFDDQASFANLKEKISGDVIFHLAVQPQFHLPIIDGLGTAGLRGKLLIEKPFGEGSESAQMLEQKIEQYFSPDSIYRVDHYLGKEGLDAVLAARRSDDAFENLLGAAHVAKVACRIEESLGIEGRGEFYDPVGALRDVGQNHLLEMLATLIAELPARDGDLPQARAQALASLSPRATHAARGQYAGYRAEEGVAPDSQTETYFRVSAASALPRWQDVELVLEAGKALKQKKSEIEIIYTDGTARVFDMEAPRTRDAYEVLIGAAMNADRARFASAPEVVAAWRFAEAAADLLRQAPLRVYERGSERGA